MGKIIKIDKAVDRIGYWVGAYTIMTGAFAWVAKQMEVYNLGWPEAFFIGLFSTGGVVLMVSAGLVGWRYFNPLPKSNISPSPPPLPQQKDDMIDEHIFKLVDARLDEFLATRLRAEFTTHAQSHEYDEKLLALSDKSQRQSDMIETLEGQINRVVQYAENHVRTTRTTFDWVDGGFRALGDREALTKEAMHVEKLAAKLLSIGDGEQPDHWGEWQGDRDTWQRMIEEYARIAERYCPEVGAAIQTVTTEDLVDNWDGAHYPFPDDKIKFAYRTVSVMLRSFRTEHGKVMKCVRSWAFNSPSKKGIAEG